MCLQSYRFTNKKTFLLIARQETHMPNVWYAQGVTAVTRCVGYPRSNCVKSFATHREDQLAAERGSAEQGCAEPRPSSKEAGIRKSRLPAFLFAVSVGYSRKNKAVSQSEAFLSTSQIVDLVFRDSHGICQVIHYTLSIESFCPTENSSNALS